MQPGRTTRRLASYWWPELAVLVLASWLLWPQHAGGYGLGHDLVFTPHQPLTADSVGLGSASPRAVPLDALVALASKLFGGMVLGRLVLLLPLLAAGWGAIRLLGSRCLPARFLVGVLAIWNPYLVERLALGQWALLWAYAALPWLVIRAHRVRTGVANRTDWAALACWLACAAITPTGALIGAVAVLVVGWTATPRSLALAAIAALAQLPWLLPALLTSAAATSDPSAVAAFAARSERPGGTVLSLLGLGGIWSADVTPASRSGLLGYLSTLLVVLVLIWGVARLGPPQLRRRLVLLAAGGFVLAAAATVPGLSAVLRWAVERLPGAGLLRDGQKWLMPFVLLAVLAAGAVVDRLANRPMPMLDPATRQAQLGWRVLLSIAGLALPLVLLPDAPATLKVPLTPVHYPRDWTVVAGQLAHQPDRAGSVLVLPFASYRAFDWAPGRSVIDPAPRWLAVPVLVDDRLAVSGRLLAGEDPNAAAVGSLLDRPAAELAPGLAARGVGWVLVEADTAGPPLPELSGLTQRYAGSSLRLYQVPGPIAVQHSRAFDRWLVIGTDLLVAALIALAAAIRIGAAARRNTPRLLHSLVTTTSEDL